MNTSGNKKDTQDHCSQSHPILGDALSPPKVNSNSTTNCYCYANSGEEAPHTCTRDSFLDIECFSRRFPGGGIPSQDINAPEPVPGLEDFVSKLGRFLIFNLSKRYLLIGYWGKNYYKQIVRNRIEGKNALESICPCFVTRGDVFR